MPPKGGAFGAIFGAKKQEPAAPEKENGNKAEAPATNGSATGSPGTAPAGPPAAAPVAGTPGPQPASTALEKQTPGTTPGPTPRMESADKAALILKDGEVREIKEIDESVLRLIPEWSTRPHKHISFKGQVKRTKENSKGQFVFRLETIDGLVRLSRRYPTEKDKISLQHLESFDVSDNALRDINCVQGTQGFASLRVLKARKNCLLKFNVNLPSLRELDLSFNRLKEIPPTSGMPELEVFVLAHNLMNGLWEPLRNLKDLKKLDLSNNRFDMRPTELGMRLTVLEVLPNLTSLRLKDNPFSRLLPEYQSIVLARLPTLQKLDDIVDKEAMDKAKELPAKNQMDVRTLTHYDRLVFERGKADRLKIDTKDPQGKKESQVPSFAELTAPLNDALEDHQVEVVHRAIKELKRLCDKVYTAQADHMQNIFREMRQEHQKLAAGERNIPSETEMISSAIEQLIDNIKIVHSRISDHPGQRKMLIRCIAKLGKVHVPSPTPLGEWCIDLLGWLMKKDEVTEKEVLDAVQEIVVQPLEHTSISDPNMIPIIRGLAKFESDRLPEALTPIASWLAMTYCNYGASPQADITRLLAVCTGNVSNVEKALAFHDAAGGSGAPGASSGGKSDGLPAHVILALDNKTLVQNESLREQYINHLKIVANTAKHGGQRVVDVYEERQLHRMLVQACKTFYEECPIDTTKPYSKSKPIRTNVELSRLKVLGLRTCATLLDAITALMTQNHDILQDLCDAKPPSGIPVVEYYSIAVRAPVADPVLLASSLKGLLLILKDYSLENAAARNEMMGLIINDFQKMTTMMQYIDADHLKYKKLWENAEKHLAEKNEGSGKSTRTDLGSAPKFTALTNPLMHYAFEAIINVIEFFTANKNQSKLCDQVSKAMDGANRERLLFRLLRVPAPLVRDAVMSCLDRVNSSEMDTDEVGYLITLLDDAKDLTAEDTLLQQVISQLTKFAAENSGGGGAGAALKNDHAEHSVESVMSILVRNEARQTYGDVDEEGEKTVLSQACVEFLQQASKWHELRDTTMRSKRISGFLVDALKFEDNLHAGTNPDIGAECTWTGRSVETLMQCLSGKERLNPRGKVAFRVIVRIADILEGHSDQPKTLEGEDRSSKSLAAEEAKMWDEGRIKRDLRILSENDMQDRAMQHNIFGNYNGIDRVVQFLTGLEVNETERAVARKDAQVSVSRATDFVEGAKAKSAEVQKKIDAEGFYEREADFEDMDTDDEGGEGPFLTYMDRLDLHVDSPTVDLRELIGRNAFVGPFGPPISFTFKARWDSMRAWATVLDFGNGEKQDNIIIGNREHSNDFIIQVYVGDKGPFTLIAQNSIVVKEQAEWLVSIHEHGGMKIWKDGTILASSEGNKPPRHIKRKCLYIGSSIALTGDGEKFDGLISLIRVFKGVKDWEAIHSERDEDELDRKVLMKVLQLKDEDEDAMAMVRPDLQVGVSLGTNVPRDLQVREDFFEDPERGLVNVAFPIVSTFRCCFALLKVAAREQIRQKMIASLKDPFMVTQLVALMKLCGPFDCRIASKFLRLMSASLTLPQSELSEEVDVVVIYDILSSYCGGLCKTVVKAMRQQDDKSLQARGRELSLEIIRLYSVMVRNVPMCHYADNVDVQAFFTEHVLFRLVPITVVKSLIHMAAVQQEVAGGSEADSKGQKAAQGNEIWELLRLVIANLLDKCPKVKYDVLMVFSTYMVTGSAALRQSFLAGLLQQMKQSEERAKIQQSFGDVALPTPEPVLPVKGATDKAKPEKTVAFARCEAIVEGVRKPASDPYSAHNFLACVVTNKNLMIIDASKPGYPQNPCVVMAWPLTDITRIVRGMPNQVLYVGWLKKSFAGKEEYEEDYLTIICHRESDRKLLIGSLHELSAPKGGGPEHRVPLQVDSTFKKALENQVPESTMMVSFVNQLTSSGELKMQLYVLSDANLYEFNTNFKNWSPAGGGGEPAEADTDSDAEDSDDGFGGKQQGGAAHQAHKKSEKAEVKGSALGGEKNPDLEICNEICRMREKARQKEDSKAAGEGTAVDDLLTDHSAKPLSGLEKIAFFPDKSPKMCLSFGNDKVTMVFFDDMSRESWKQALIGLVNKADNGKWTKSYQGRGAA